jgi:hypothetical protein
MACLRRVLRILLRRHMRILQKVVWWWSFERRVVWVVDVSGGGCFLWKVRAVESFLGVVSKLYHHVHVSVGDEVRKTQVKEYARGAITKDRRITLRISSLDLTAI